MKREKVKFIFYAQNLIRLQWKPINLSTWNCLHSKMFHSNWTRDEKMFSNQLVKSLFCLINDWNLIFRSKTNWFSCGLSQHFCWHIVGKCLERKSGSEQQRIWMILEMTSFPAKTEMLKYRAYISEHLTYFLLFDLILPACSLAAVFARTNTFHITSIEGVERMVYFSWVPKARVLLWMCLDVAVSINGNVKWVNYIRKMMWNVTCKQ